MDALARRLDAVLPQTQCTRCGFPSCADYAEALSRGDSDINRCPPGGEHTVALLSGLTGRPVAPIDPECGAPAPRAVAVVDEAWCIGCTLCIQACPVEAIVGGARRMHTVIERLCTGCELCVAPCPVDCIEMRPAREGPGDAVDWLRERAAEMRERHAARNRRLGVARRRFRRRHEDPGESASQRRATIADAVARTRARRAARRGSDGGAPG